MNLNKYLSIDIGGTAIKYALLDENAIFIKTNQIKTNIKEWELFSSLDEIISYSLNEIDGIAISFPGPVNIEKGIVINADSFGWIKEFPLKSILENKYEKTVWIENDGKCNALAELWKGNLSNTQNGIVIGLGTAIAGGIILNGKLYRGINGSAAEFSSIIIDFENPSKARKFSQVAGYRNLLNLYSRYNGEDSTEINTHEFFKRYYGGDEVALKALNDYAKFISAGIINLQSILDVEKFCIGGGISAHDVLIDEIRKSVHDYFVNVSSEVIKEPEIDKCYFGNSAGCVGALYNFLVMEEMIDFVVNFLESNK